MRKFKIPGTGEYILAIGMAITPVHRGRNA